MKKLPKGERRIVCVCFTCVSGSIVLEECVKENVKGVIVNVARRGAPDGGRIVVWNEDCVLVPKLDKADDENVFVYRERDIFGQTPRDRFHARAGDLVTFSVCKVKATGEIHASKIMMNKTSKVRAEEILQKQLEEMEPEVGTIHSLANNSTGLSKVKLCSEIELALFNF